MDFTRTERLMLWNQLEILKHVRPGGAGDCEEQQRILENGYKIFYGEIARHISEADTLEEVCTEVLQILSMYRALGDSGGTTKGAKFLGFDGNEETDHYAFASFLMDAQGKFGESAKCPRNSHHPTLDKYRRMLATWKRFGSEYRLSTEQVAEIVKS